MLKIARVVLNCTKKHTLTRNITLASSASCKTNNQEMASSKKYVPIYKFPYIRQIAVVNRMKLYQAGFAALSIPSTIIGNYFGTVAPETVGLVVALSVFGFLPLFGISYFLQKFVGFIYYNAEEDKVMVAFVDSWGRRKSIVCPREDITPLDDLPVKFTDGLYVSLTRFSTEEKLKLNLQFGTILDETLFKKVLG